MKTIFKNCDVLIRKDGVYQVLEHAFLAVEGATITHIGTEKPEGHFGEERDFSNKLLIPGLYNCHTHSPMVLFRGAGNELPLERWLKECIFPLEQKLDEEAIAIASRLAIMEMLACGTVSFTDMYFSPEVTAREVMQSGIKANLCKHLQFPQAGDLEKSVRFVRSFNEEADGRILADFGIHACYSCDEETATKYSEICKDCGGRMHIHLAETNNEVEECKKRFGVTPAAWFARVGALSQHTTAAHCVCLTENDMALLAEKGVTIAHCPTGNLKLGSGIAPVPFMLEKGDRLALGTDGAASNNNLNLLEEMHLAALIHKGIAHNPTVAGTDTILDMATLNGAYAQGRKNCGELKVGNKADIVAIDLQKPHLQSAFEPKALLTYSAQAADVCMTMVDGKILYENGEYLTIDKEKTLFEFRQLARQWNP